jgi:type VI secretion system secreted protein VgrG
MSDLGWVSEKFESAGAGPGTISNTSGDPGGKSYGIWQLAINTGALGKYLQICRFKDQFDGLQLGSLKFDAEWKYIAQTETKAFRADQHDYIKEQYYDPIRSYCNNDLKFPINDAINNALWSIGVQHGRWKIIVNNAYDTLSDNVTIKQIIYALYESRREYIKHCGLPQHIELALMARYEDEEQEILKLC